MNIKKLGKADYAPTFEATKTFNAARTPDTEDEIWLVEHPSKSTAAARLPTTAPAKSSPTP